MTTGSGQIFVIQRSVDQSLQSVPFEVYSGATTLYSLLGKFASGLLMIRKRKRREVSFTLWAG